MVLSSFGAYGQLAEMEARLQKTKDSGMGPSIRTFNTVLDSCPKLITLLYSNASEDLPLLLEELVDYLGGDECAVVLRLVDPSSLIKNRSMWASLDLHGMHLTTAYLFMLMWVDELSWICKSEGDELPSEIRVVCGMGSHSAVRYKSPVKDLVRKMIAQMDCPLRNDNKRMGSYVAKGKVLRNWILSYKGRRLTQL